jgi:hypothetical protein
MRSSVSLIRMCLRLGSQSVVNNAVLEENVVCGEREGPCCRGGCHERHMDAETDLGSHVADRFSDGCAKVIDHKSRVTK